MSCEYIHVTFCHTFNKQKNSLDSFDFSQNRTEQNRGEIHKTSKAKFSRFFLI
jgi:hypothetical protein